MVAKREDISKAAMFACDSARRGRRPERSAIPGVLTEPTQRAPTEIPRGYAARQLAAMESDERRAA